MDDQGKTGWYNDGELLSMGGDSSVATRQDCGFLLKTYYWLNQ